MNAFANGEVCAATSSLALEQDVAWMMAFQAGDRASFGRIVEEYRRPVISSRIPPGARFSIAEELSQEVFLRVYRTRDYQPTARFRSWLFRIATNLALNWLRDHRHEACHQRLDHPPAQARLREPQARMPNMEEFLLRMSRLAEVRAAIQELPAESSRRRADAQVPGTGLRGDGARHELLRPGHQVAALSRLRKSAQTPGPPGSRGANRGLTGISGALCRKFAVCPRFAPGKTHPCFLA